MEKQLKLVEMPPAFCIDASALVDLKRWYPQDMKTFLPIWKQIELMIKNGGLISPAEVQKEISKGNDEIVKWCRKYKIIFKDVDTCQANEIHNVEAKYDKEAWDKGITKDGRWGDPWVIALSICEEAVIVTNENKVKPNRIPDIARKFNIRCLQLLEFFKEIGIE
jgi:hypothetical protein